MSHEVADKKQIALALVKKILEEREKRGELSVSQRVTLDYATKLSKIEDAEESNRLIEKLCEGHGISRGTAAQIANVMPTHPDELRPLMTAEKRAFMRADLESIISVLDKYRKQPEK